MGNNREFYEPTRDEIDAECERIISERHAKNETRKRPGSRIDRGWVVPVIRDPGIPVEGRR